MKIDQTRDLVLFSCAEKVFSDQELWLINNTANKSDKNISQVGIRLIKFCNLYDLKKISDQAQAYAEPLNARYNNETRAVCV